MKTLLILVLLLVAHPGVAQQNAFTVTVTGKGQPIILIPGYSCSGEVWKETVDHLKDRYECHVLTLAGFAGVPPIQRPVLQTVRDQIIQYVRTKQLKNPILLGHSLGAFMSLWVSSTEPSLFAKIICVDGLPFISAMMNPSIQADSLRKNPMYDPEAVARNFVSIPDSTYKSSVARSMMAQVRDSARAEQIAGWSAACDRKTLGYTFVEMSVTDLRKDLARIKVPVLVLGSLYGNKETTARVMAEQYRYLANKTIAVASTKHFIMYDDPQWFYQQLDSFLTQQPVSTQPRPDGKSQ